MAFKQNEARLAERCCKTHKRELLQQNTLIMIGLKKSLKVESVKIPMTKLKGQI